MTTYKTRTYALWTALETELTGASWSGNTPQIVVGDPGPKLEREAVIIESVAEGNDADWATLGQQNKDEECRLVITVMSAIPGASNSDARARLQELTDIVEDCLRPLTSPPTLGVGGVWSVVVSSLLPRVEGAAEGWIGYAEIRVLAKARI